ncbi:hypothetical protein GQ42DRAFT_81458 [Ramicandelaber brevisporus]|nr:hypothetical protein GQ42DRAFT_81458 [Ramicandelaber brevisporus]
MSVTTARLQLQTLAKELAKGSTRRIRNTAASEELSQLTAYQAVFAQVNDWNAVAECCIQREKCLQLISLPSAFTELNALRLRRAECLLEAGRSLLKAEKELFGKAQVSAVDGSAPSFMERVLLAEQCYTRAIALLSSSSSATSGTKNEVDEYGYEALQPMQLYQELAQQMETLQLYHNAIEWYNHAMDAIESHMDTHWIHYVQLAEATIDCLLRMQPAKYNSAERMCQRLHNKLLTVERTDTVRSILVENAITQRLLELHINHRSQITLPSKTRDENNEIDRISQHGDASDLPAEVHAWFARLEKSLRLTNANDAALVAAEADSNAHIQLNGRQLQLFKHLPNKQMPV